MTSEAKNPITTCDFEVDSQDLHLQSKIKTLGIVDSVRIGITTLALLMGITILGVSANTLAVYNSTHVSADFFLPLWPDHLNLRPTIALVVGSTIVFLANVVSLVFSKVKSLRNMTPVHTSLTFVAPLIGFSAALIAVVFFYVVNASSTVDTLLSWTCRWEVVSMSQRPHWGQLCKESRAGVYLSVLLVPVEALVLAVAGYQMTVERHASAYARARKGSPPLS